MSNIKKKEYILMAEFLDNYSESASNAGCNDWEFPSDWTEAEKFDFVKQYHDWNGDPEEFDPGYLFLSDVAVAEFLSFKAEAEAKENNMTKVIESNYHQGEN